MEKWTTARSLPHKEIKLFNYWNLLQGSRHCFLPWLIDVYTFSVLSPLFSLVDKDRKTFLVARSDTPCLMYLRLIIPHAQSVSGHVVQAKRCFPPVRLGYIIDVNWSRKTRQRYFRLDSQTFKTWMDYSISFSWASQIIKNVHLFAENKKKKGKG